MRAAVLAAVALAVPLTASASPYHAVHALPGSPFSDVIMHPPKRGETSGPIAFANVSNVIYVNPCLPNGCTVRPGADNAQTNTSSIASRQTLLTAWPHGDEEWNELMTCVRGLYAPFNVVVTDVDPGNAPHHEVMVAGTAAALDMEGAGGVAPFIACNGNIPDNVISFVFAAQTDSIDFMCWAVAQESSHVFGLDHELLAKDPLTYLTPPIRKPGFQNVEAKCGEDEPRECWCGGETQNSYQYLMDVFGPAQLEPATLSITSPVDGAWVKPGFTVRADLISQLSIVDGALQIDGTTANQIDKGDDLVWTTSSQLAGGQHTLSIVATDTGDRSLASEPVTVTVTARCSPSQGIDCAKGTHCLGGYCLPGASIAGGLGAACTGPAECLTETCASDGATSLCSGTCDAGFQCPDGFDCLADGGSGICWPGEPDEGGCASSSTPRHAWFALIGLAALVLTTRRRRR